MKRCRVVIVGGGFAGLEAAKALAGSPVDITLIDRQNHHCFQPLLYQVATATLSPADVAWPIRSILSRQRNATVLMASVTDIDCVARTVQTESSTYPFDKLIVATGATHAYFGNDAWAGWAPGLKSIEDATEIRRRLLIAFENAEQCDDLQRRNALMTFAVIGGGPTGVELAGAIADMAREALPRDFRRIEPALARVLLIEAGSRLLAAYPERASAYAYKTLEKRGVEVLLGNPVTKIDDAGVTVGRKHIPTGAVVWAAGVAASPAARWLGADHDKAGRVLVESDLSLPGQPDVFVIGDTASVRTDQGTPVPGIAPAAKQMGRFVGELIDAQTRGCAKQERFVYRHQGDLATIGRGAAVVRFSKLQLCGFAAWSFWGIVHIYFLIGARNRIAVAFSWIWDYMTFSRRARLITNALSDHNLRR